MKKILAVFLNLVVILNFSGGCCFAKQINVPSGTTVRIISEKMQNSKNLTSGDKLEAIIQQDIIIDDVVVFKRGDRATLNVSHAKKAGFVGIPGELVISGGEIVDANNQTHLVDFSRSYVGDEKTWPKVCLGCGVFIILAPLALFGFVKGGQAEIRPNLPIDVRVLQDFNFDVNL